jgi:hypothetical protein
MKQTASGPVFLERASGIPRRGSSAPDRIVVSYPATGPSRRRSGGDGIGAVGPRVHGPPDDPGREGSGSTRSGDVTNLYKVASRESRGDPASFFFELLSLNTSAPDWPVGLAFHTRRSGLPESARAW